MNELCKAENLTAVDVLNIGKQIEDESTRRVLALQKTTPPCGLPAAASSPAFAPSTPPTTTAGATTKTFAFPVTGQSVRIIVKEGGEPWFVARDVAECLEYNLGTNLTNIFKNVPEQWKGINRINTLGGTQNLLTISEQGLYFFLGRSDKPKALPYQMWIAGEVVPSIRRTGGYMFADPEESPETLMARALFVAHDALERAKAKLTEAQPKVAAFDALLNAKGVYTVTEAAKHFGLSARRLNDFLCRVGWMFKKCMEGTRSVQSSPIHLPCQRIIDQEYALVKTRTLPNGLKVSQPYITPRGLIALERLLSRYTTTIEC